MSVLYDDITAFLEGRGIGCMKQVRGGLAVIRTENPSRIILPLEISAHTVAEAEERSRKAYATIREIKVHDGTYPLIITEDRWNAQRDMTRSRLLAHLEIFSSAFARNCEVRRIDKAEARNFLTANHSYGYATCRHHYGLYLKSMNRLVAVATFSNARKWVKDGKEIRSYEWTRYASLPDLRISGGMGKLLKAFIKEIGPDDIMSYADLEWSEGNVYQSLGFTREEGKGAVTFIINPATYQRKAIGKLIPDDPSSLYFTNFGSAKYRLKLTEYSSS